MLPWAHLRPYPNGISTGSAVFCTAHGRRALYFTMGRPFPPQNCPCTWGIWTSSNTCFLGPPHSASQMASWWVQPFCKAHGRKSLYFTMGCPFSRENCPFAWEDLDPYLIHGSLCSPESIKQVTSRTFQPFWQGSWLWQTDRPTDWQTTLLHL